MRRFWSVLFLSLYFSAAANAADVVAISAGSSVANGAYSADTDFSGGTPYNNNIVINTTNVVNPAPQAVYDNVRYGANFSYVIPGLAAGGVYLVRLHFAEIYFTSAGSRVFNVSINGTPVLFDFDIFSVSGGQGIANAQQFQAQADANGRITIAFSGVVENAQVNGIEVSAVSSLPVPTPAPSYNLLLTSDKASYVAGATATVVASLSSTPENPEEEFFVTAMFAGNSLHLTRLTKTESYAITPALASGASLFIAQVYLQNAKEAKALNDATKFYQNDIAALQAQLAVTTDPNAIATINSEIAVDLDRLGATQGEFSRIRTPVGPPVTITLIAH